MQLPQNNSKPNFDMAEHLARELRLLQPHSNLALNMLEMDFDRDIYFETFENYVELTRISTEELTNFGRLDDGYTIKCGNTNLILYHKTRNISPRLNWTLAHEVGHIYLNHRKDSDIEEVEAHWFAAELLMPIPIILNLCKGMRVSNSVLEDLFCVSPNAALKRIDSLNRMCAFSTYLQDDFDNKYVESIKKVNNVQETTTKYHRHSREQI